LSTGPILVCGPEMTAWDFELPEGTAAVGVRFRPGALPHLVSIPASSIRDIRIPLGRIIGEDAEDNLRIRIEAPTDLDARRRVLESFTAQLVTAVPNDAAPNEGAPNDFADRVLDQLASTPRANAAQLADQFGLMARQLHRRCLFSFGYGPSILARILRFQRFLALAETVRDAAGRRRGLALLAIDAGYSDQAHLARDCRAITGQTPTRFLVDYFPTFPDMSDPYKTSDSFAITMSA
jgi:AraC-like DNA-binding protein